MSNNDQNEYGLPTPGNDERKSAALLPRFFRTEANKKFLQATLDQLTQPGVAEKVNGYYGRTTAKAFQPSDNYIEDFSEDRKNRQLEPALVIKDDLDNVTFYKDYNDYINQIKALGGNVDNHDILNRQDTYAWNPNIDWDKFVNFREYYWMPNGPLEVAVLGQSREITSTYQIKTVDDGDNIAYVFTPNGKTRNPSLTLYRGQTYRFEVDTPGYPISFAVTRSYTRGIGTVLESENVSSLFKEDIVYYDSNGEVIEDDYIEKGVIEFTVPFDAPDNLFYISETNIDTSGYIKIFDIEENTFIDVESEILGKTQYKSSNDIELSNGMKIFFRGNVTPEKYSSGFWYVEGVGEEIKLVNAEDLIIPSDYSRERNIPFDSDPFDRLPFDDANFYAEQKDYIVINRSSNDKNPWSRYNKWIHREVLEKSYEYNNLPVNINEAQRARRPIIEFEADLKLYNYGTSSKADVDLIDDFTTDVFSVVEGSIGYNIDGVDLVDGMRILFTADRDIFVKDKIFQVKFVLLSNQPQISLVEVEDTEPLMFETVLVKQGIANSGKTFYYDGDNWKLAQEKTQTNQPPLFDLCCPEGNFYGDEDVFESSTFAGTKIFSYKIGEGEPDTELGFPLTYKNINNSGDIVFEFNLLTDQFNIQTEDSVLNIETKYGNLRKYQSRDEFTWVNGWSSTPRSSEQKAVRQYVATRSQLNDFEIDVYDRAGNLNDLKAFVYLNNSLQKNTVDYEIARQDSRAFVNFKKEITTGDVIVIKTASKTSKNSNGYYEFPINLENNPLNENVTEFTFGEVFDHVASIVEELDDFKGSFPGNSNIRDLGDIDSFGKRFVKHSGPINLPLYHITNKDYNIVKALEFSKKEYSKFKRIFVEAATNLGYDGPIKQHTDLVLKEVNKDKVKSQPFYFSDMLAYDAANRIEYKVLDTNGFYALTNSFNLNNLSSKQVSVYLNGKQLIHQKEYTFTDEGFVVVNAGQQIDDLIEIYEYESTDGNFVPPTPTKLGLYPKYIPEIVIDDTYISDQIDTTGPFKVYGETKDGTYGWFYPVYASRSVAKYQDQENQVTSIALKGLSKILYAPSSLVKQGAQDNQNYDQYPVGIPMIQGHDGSRIRAYLDYRDDLLLDFEKRIYNNIKIDYEETLLDINDFVSGKFRKTDFDKSSIEKTLIKDFIKWTSLIDNDYTLNDFYDRNNQFTFNYSFMNSAVDSESLPGFWRGVYIEAFDTDRPHTHPWEMLGFSIKPEWWETVYGPAPYTRNNGVLWEDLEKGIVREPNQPLRVREKYIRPGLTKFIPVDEHGSLLSPLRSNYAKNFYIRDTSNNFSFGDYAPVETAWRRSSEYPFALIKAWLLNQPARVMGLGFDVSRVYKNLSGQQVYKDTLEHIKIDQLILPNTFQDNERQLTSGLVNYIYNLTASNILKIYDDYKNDLLNIQNQLGIKIGGFTDKSKFKLILDSRSPTSDLQEGIFVPEENYQIFLNTSSVIDLISYSGVIIEKASDGFIIRGYDDENPVFRYYSVIESSDDIPLVVGGISENTVNWNPNTQYFKGEIVENNQKFYRVTQTFTSNSVFSNFNLSLLPELPIIGGRQGLIRKRFNKSSVKEIAYGSKMQTIQDVIDFILGYGEYLTDAGFEFDFFNSETQYVENWKHSVREFLFWTTQEWSEGTTLAISPASQELKFSKKFSVVDDIYDRFYDYSLLRANGSPLERRFSSLLRDGNNFGLTLKNTDDGIYNIKLPLVQKEHVVLLDNNTIFDDLIYDPSTGYRQERIRVLGYRSDNWNGSLNIPGFVYDDAKVTEWESWKDYEVGSLVKYKQFYYVAIFPVTGASEFNPNFWSRLNEKPESKLMTNFDYRINQFTDFYDLDSDNFDAEQQRLAQHLIGYQKRNYLANIINDDVSQYKFYQGFIQDKGTKNAIEKLFNPLSSANKDGLELYEEWAIQVGRYGATDEEKQVEFVLDESKILESPQSFELTDNLPIDAVDNVYRIKSFEVYDKPEEYNHKPFPTTNLKSYIIDSGYVHEDDVDYKTKSLIDLSVTNVNDLNSGEYIWITNDNDNTWNVYQVYDKFSEIIQLINNQEQNDQGESLITLRFNTFVKGLISKGDVVGALDAQDYNLFGLYEVDQVENDTVKVIVPGNTNILEFTEEIFPAVKLRKTRTNDLDSANAIVQEKIFDNQKIWVDNYKDNSWAVIENTPVYTQLLDIPNPSDNDSLAHDFGRSIDTTLDNRNLFVSSPGDNSGKVYVYRRTNDFSNLLGQDPITVPEGYFENEFSCCFGKSISVSDDGKYLAVGIPKASGVKTRFKGQFSDEEIYNKNDIVKYDQKLWKTNREILPSTENILFSTFDNYVNLVEQGVSDSSEVELLVTGDPELENNTVDHILVRAPADSYAGTKIGDSVKLFWNTRSYAQLTLNNYEPWSRGIAELTSTFINDTHVISKKVDLILYVESFVTVPTVGDSVETNSSSAEVVYVGTKDNSLVLYLNNINGEVATDGDIFIQEARQLIGTYTHGRTANFSENLGGFWLINTPNYNNGTDFYETGRGLVYVDVLRQEDTRDENNYYNIQTAVKTVVGNIGNLQNKKDKVSYITHLSYEGTPGPNNVNVVYHSDLWAVRVGNDFNLSDFNEPFNFELYNPIDRDLDLESKGFDFSVFNNSQTVEYIWDGFIEYQLVADNQSRLFELAARYSIDSENNIVDNGENSGDIIEDRQYQFDQFGDVSNNFVVTSTAEVMFVQRNGNSVRIYINKLSGNWTLNSNIARVDIARKSSEDPLVDDGNYDVDRISGIILDFNNDVVVENNNIGKLLIFKNAEGRFPIVTDPEIINEEYFFYNEDVNVEGTVRPASIPSEINRDYTQVYNIPADIFGSSDLVNEGAVAIYGRNANGIYSLNTILTSEYPTNNKHFGTKVKIVKNQNLYKIIISNASDLDDNLLSMEIFDNGFEESDNFVGEWSSLNLYRVNDIVEYKNNYYRSLTNITSNGTQFDINNSLIWENVSWKRSVDERYKGEVDVSETYNLNDVVLNNGILYRSLTNSPSFDFNNNSNWLMIGDVTDYLNYPNAINSSIKYVKDYDISDSGTVLCVLIRANKNTDSKILIYRLINGIYKLDQEIDSINQDFLDYIKNIRISSNGMNIVVSEPETPLDRLGSGKVYVLSQDNENFVLRQTLRSPQNESIEKFGFSISYSNDNLVVSSLNGDMKLPTTFDVEDGNETTFDNDFTEFRNIIKDSGMVYVFEDFENKLLFSESFRYDLAESFFGENILTKGNHIYVGLPKQQDSTDIGTVLDYRKPKDIFGWNNKRTLVTPVDIEKIHGAFLYNRRKNEIVTYLDYIDPIQGKIAGPAEQELTYKTGYDPAVYNTGSNSSDSDAYWASEHVGELWWNIENAQFTYTYTGDILYQKENWNELQPGSTINVYEWVESTLSPEQWDSISDTEEGLKSGISGTSLYGNEFYTKRFDYDSASQKFIPIYYFWVEFKSTVPQVSGRNLSALSVARLIARPREQGYRFISFLGNDRFILNNCNNLIYNDDIVLNIKYSEKTKTGQNVHSQYQILTDGFENTKIDANIERKWFDSLIGYNEQGLKVPNPRLSVKQRYGVQNRPRQGMFVNRFEALKQLIERVNIVLKSNIIVDNKNISRLLEKDPQPSSVLNLYDQSVEIYDELSFIGTNKISQAVLEPVIVNGELERVNIINPGRGYRVPPTFDILGKGKNADFDISINNLGQIISVNITSRGFGYDENTRISIRKFSVLVNNDRNVRNKWAIYSWNNTESSWVRESVQDYDVTAYWDYIDWYSQGYNEFTKIDYLVDQSYELNSINDSIGNVVKIKNVGSGGWLLLEKISNKDTEDYTQNYRTIGRENGTIQFKNTLYDYQENSIGFDNRSFDNYFYDNDPVTELRIILNAIKSDIFIEELKIEYNQLFFASLRYIMSEQQSVDWMFKTSFIKIKHNRGELEQNITFKNNTLPSYQGYVNEVKPYKSVIREFVSSYEKIDNTNSAVTDFDLPAYYNKIRETIEPATAKISNNNLENVSDKILEYPRKFWYDNFEYKIKEILIYDTGEGYLGVPKIRIQGGGGSGASAEAAVTSGKLNAINLTSVGNGYTSSPQVVIEGPLADDGRPAKAVAILDKNLVRNFDIGMKFDRISGNTKLGDYKTIESLDRSETFIGTGADVDFVLEWPMDIKYSNVSIKVNGNEILRNEVEFSNIVDLEKSYTRQRGKISFNIPPELDSVVKIDYKISLDMLNAEERIKFSYMPTTGMLDNDLSQLMSGIDYAGVEVTSFDFGAPGGWDSQGWGNDIWDQYDNTFEDEVFTFDGSTTVIELLKPLENDIIYNVYLNGIRIDDSEYDGSTTGTENNPNAQMLPITGDGITQNLSLDDLGITVTDNDTLIVRKESSDGSFVPSQYSFDTQLTGGSFTSSLGINAEEIIVDGDGFVTENTNAGPEELVPGQVLDTLDIKVYTRGEDSTFIAYRQFKDILNRTHFKRLDAPVTELAKDLNYYDLRIEVVDASNLPEPNKNRNLPGIIYINKERIEYFVKDGNTLRQLRRGTLGTGVKQTHEIGSSVYDQGISKTIEYKDTTAVQEIVVPDIIVEELDSATQGYNLLENDPLLYNKVEVYNSNGELLTEDDYRVESFYIVFFIDITEKVTIKYSDQTRYLMNFDADNVNQFEVFLSGRRLENKESSVFNLQKSLDSPEGDDIIGPDFVLETDVNGNTYIRLTSVPETDQNIKIVRKTGSLWTQPGESITEEQNEIGYFLRSGTPDIPE